MVSGVPVQPVDAVINSPNFESICHKTSSEYFWNLSYCTKLKNDTVESSFAVPHPKKDWATLSLHLSLHNICAHWGSTKSPQRGTELKPSERMDGRGRKRRKRVKWEMWVSIYLYCLVVQRGRLGARAASCSTHSWRCLAEGAGWPRGSSPHRCCPHSYSAGCRSASPDANNSHWCSGTCTLCSQKEGTSREEKIFLSTTISNIWFFE